MNKCFRWQELRKGMPGDGTEEVLRGHMTMGLGLLGYELHGRIGEQRV